MIITPPPCHRCGRAGEIVTVADRGWRWWCQRCWADLEVTRWR